MISVADNNEGGPKRAGNLFFDQSVGGRDRL